MSLLSVQVVAISASFVDIGHATSHFVICSKGPYFMYDRNLGGEGVGELQAL